MTVGKNWVEVLKTQLFETADNVLFEEASQCFLNRQLRSAYIITWISIIESLKRKIFILSNLCNSR
jgi:hypothetical protein